jgi:hypothetical protein
MIRNHAGQTDLLESIPQSQNLATKNNSKFGRWLLVGSLLFLAIVFVFCTVQVLLGNIWIGHWLWASPASFSLVFIGTALLLRKRGLRDSQVFIISLTTMVSMIWMYELFYFLGFWADWNLGNETSIASYQVLLSHILWISPALVGLKYMKFSIPFVVCALLFFMAFLFWVIIGYPQINAPGQLFPFNGAILIHVTNPGGWAIFENEITKYLLAASYVSVFIQK